MIGLIEKVKNTKKHYLSNDQLTSYHVKKITKKELRKRVNTLENELTALKNVIKENLFSELMVRLNEPEEIKALKEENKKLRIKNRYLKKRLCYNEKFNKSVDNESIRRTSL